MNRETAISILKRNEAELKKLGVRHLSLFGSTARNTASDISDIDIAVTLHRGPRGLARLEHLGHVRRRLSDLLLRPIDLVEEPARSLRVQQAIERNRQVAF